MTTSPSKLRKSPVKKVLVANRGEIACRIMTTLKAMGIASVAVYSDADSNAKHVSLADEAYHIGPSPVGESYLKHDVILEAAKQTHADAIHPGYGFLSENPEFAQAVERANIRFIGPSASVIRRMGDKIQARASAEEAGVPIIPGIKPTGDKINIDEVLSTIGTPVMIKAAAGGGGRGIRIVHAADAIAMAIDSAQAEARQAFGDDRIYIERYITNPRHIEVQILADQHGNVIHLGDRDCSIQRRHQKLIEETPSPDLCDDMRERIGKMAVLLARHVGYESAGTIEMVLDPGGDIFFMEMNTRLQVEHTITEACYGIDLVEWMVRIAAGEALPFKQKDLQPQGHAIEARINAEDPMRNALPSTGIVRDYHEPRAKGIRVDSGIYSGSEVSPWYDSLIAKVISHGKTREAARQNLIRALDDFTISGVQTNKSLLQAIMRQKPFIAGDLTTEFIAKYFPEGLNADHVIPPRADIFILTATLLEHDFLRHMWQGKSSYPVTDYIVDGHPDTPKGGYGVTLTCPSGQPDYSDISSLHAHVDNKSLQILSSDGPRHNVSLAGDHSVCVHAYRQGFAWHLSGLGGYESYLRVWSPNTYQFANFAKRSNDQSNADHVLSPLPALVSEVHVTDGTEVTEGTHLVVLEAMKMVNVVSSPCQGKIKQVHIKPGDRVEVNQLLVSFASQED